MASPSKTYLVAVIAIVAAHFMPSVAYSDKIRDRNRKAEDHEKDNIRKKYTLEKGYFVGFSRTIHFRDGVKATLNYDDPDTYIKAGKDFNDDYQRVKKEAAQYDIRIPKDKTVAQGQLFVEHWEGNDVVNTKTPRSWIFWGAWRIPRDRQDGELKRKLEALDRKTLKRTLEGMDRATLKAGLEVIGRPTLKAGLESIDRPTLKAGLEAIDRPTLKVALQVIDDGTLKVAWGVIDNGTRRTALEVADQNVRRRIEGVK
jgi:hypothetical protein